MISPFFLFAGLLLCSAFFSASETAIFSLSRFHIHRFRASRSRAARRVVECLTEPRRTLVTILLGNELINVSMSIVGAEIVSRSIPGSVQYQTLIAVVIVAPIVLVFGEIIPKNIALRLASRLAPIVVAPLRLFQYVVTPLRMILNAIADGMVRLFGGRPERVEPMIVEQEFRQLVDLGRAEGVIVETEQELIHNVFEFKEKVVADIMTPARMMFALSVDMPYAAMLTRMKATPFSRIPIYEGSKDRIIGILHLRDLFAFDRRGGPADRNIRELLHTPLFVTEHERIETLFKKFQEGQMHLACVMAAGGEIKGLVALDDVLRELFGVMVE